MPKPPVPEHISQMLAQPNPAVITAIRPDGVPVSVATWYLWQDGRILVNMDAGRKRLAYLKDNPNVSVTVLDSASWYTHVSVQGRVVEFVEDPELVDIDRIAVHYTGHPYATSRDRLRVSAWVEVDRWHGWANGAPIHESSGPSAE